MSSGFPLSAYLQHLGFTRNPFPVTPDEHGIFFSARLAEQFTELLHFIEQRKGFMLVTGDVGVGKTTLSRSLLTRLAEQGACTALVFNTFLQGADLLRAINRDFGVTAAGDSLEAQLQALNTWLLQQHEKGRNCVLILDDAQGLDVPSLELVRQLSNLEASQAKLLQIVMVAQPEIRLTLDRHDMRQLASRIALRLELTPLTLNELDVYLHHRLQWAGCPEVLTVDRSALQRLHRYSMGYIRRVHILLDRCLYGLVATGTTRISAGLVDTAAKELSLVPAPKRRAYRSLVMGSVLVMGGVAGAVGLAAVAGYPLDLLSTPSTPIVEVPPQQAGIDLQAEPQQAVPQPQPQPQQQATPQEAVVQAVVSQEASQEATQNVHQEAASTTEQQETVQVVDFAWQAFTATYTPLPPVEAPPQHWADVVEWLPARSEEQPWVPVLLPSEWEQGCNDQPLYPLSDGRLALFQSVLPVAPQPFGEEGEPLFALQLALVERLLLAPEAVDGVMGPRTANALAQFQKQSGLLASGQPDAETSYLLSCLGEGGL